jgi:hypothetical protein
MGHIFSVQETAKCVRCPNRPPAKYKLDLDITKDERNLVHGVFEYTVLMSRNLPTQWTRYWASTHEKWVRLYACSLCVDDVAKKHFAYNPSGWINVIK